MRLAPFLALLSVTFTVVAQTPASSTAASVTVLGASPFNLACPVGMRAERQASGQREWIVSLEDLRRPESLDRNRPQSAGVRVVLDGISARKMGQAEVAVYYRGPGVRALPLSEATGSAPITELKETFVLSAADAAPSLRLTGSLLVGPASTISRVRLLSITYADGTEWRAKSGNDCSVEPGLLMVVAGR